MLQKSPTAWPPDYNAHLAFRQKQIELLRSSQRTLIGAQEYYRTHPVEFIENWCMTVDPRNAGSEMPTQMPFMLFPRQKQFVEFLYACLRAEANGLVEKSRDMGATWLCCAFSVWLFLFMPGARVGWGSRKSMLVDTIGNMDSIFEKMRYTIRTLPEQFKPIGFGEDNMSSMKIHWGESSITGEGGDDIGRGGRTLIYFKDESAHYEHPEAIEASLGDNTRVQIDISSVNGLGNVFHRKREAGAEWEEGRPIVHGRSNVFVLDWTDHPLKTKAWHDKRESEAVDNGLLHVFRQEVDRSYDASVEGVIIPPAWVRSSIDAHLRIRGMHKGGQVGALDVADGGGDRNALAVREGVILQHCEEWGERDTGVTTRRAVGGVEPFVPLSVQYDCIGVGSGVKAEVNRLADDDLMPEGIVFISWDAGAGPQWPDEHVIPDDEETPLNKDFYANLKAQGWWMLRRRFERTHRAIKKLDGDPAEQNFTWNVDELISLPSTLPTLRSIQKELSQPTAGKSSRMKLLVNKTPNGSRSPNKGDAIMQCYWPIEDTNLYDDSMSWVSEAA